MSQKPYTFLLQGGLDLVTPRSAARPGTLSAVQNFECAELGMRRIDGYERFDGTPYSKPSEATYYYMAFDHATAAFAQGDIIHGASSDIYATAAAAGVLTSGSYGSGNGVGYVALMEYDRANVSQAPLTGAEVWIDNENLQVGGITRATLDGQVDERNAPTSVLDASLLHAEMERRRTAIAKPAGSGAIRAAWTLNGVPYCIRDNAGATAAVLFKSGTSGWTAVTFGERVSFTSGTAAFLEGETLTKGGVTSTIVRVILQSGSWGTTAAGYIVITGRAGGNYSAGAATSASGAATLSGAQTTITLSNGGQYTIRNHSFSGLNTDLRTYGCGGVDHAFEWDGTYFVPIIVPGLTTAQDKPNRLDIFAEHLFLSFIKGNVIYSDLGNPRQFITANDAGEFNFGRRPRNVMATSDALVISSYTKISYLTGSSNDDFVLKVLTASSGSKPFTMQMMDQPIFVDERGIRKLSSVQALGDWKMGSVSEAVSPVFAAKKKAGVEPVCAITVKGKNQYRVFFDDGSGMSVYFGRKYPEITMFTSAIAWVVTNTSDFDAAYSEGKNDITLMGSTDGYVYQLDAGNNSDGTAISAWMLPHYAAPAGPAQNYRFHSATIDIDAEDDFTLGVSAEFGFGNANLFAGDAQTDAVTGDDIALSDMYWENIDVEKVQTQVSFPLNGGGCNCMVPLSVTATYEAPMTFSAIRLLWTPRKLIRG